MARHGYREVIGATTVELTEEAVFAKALGDVAAQVKDAMRTLKRMPLPSEVRGMTKVVAAINSAMAGAGEEGQRRRPPTSAAIDRVDVVIECLFGIEDLAARNLLVVRGLGFTWDEVIEKLGLGCSISTVKRRHGEALVKMLCAMLERGAKKG